MKNSLKFALNFGIIAAIIGLALAVVFQITDPIIKVQDAKALQEGLQNVFSGNYEFEELKNPIQSLDPSVQILDTFLVKDKNSNSIEGGVLTVVVAGSQAPIKMLVGVKKDGTISGITILSMQETAGLGANAENPSYYVDKKNKITFLGQFKGKNVEKEKLIPKEDIIAITGATITSKAIATGAKVAGESFLQYLKEAHQ